MRRRLAVRCAMLVVLAAFGVGAAFALGGPILRTAHNPKLGAIVVDSKGRTLYHLTSEKNGAIRCIALCTRFWLPVLWSGKGTPALGAGVKAAKLGRVKRPNGSIQLTYGRFPLYRYYGDRAAGQTNGEGIPDGAGTWYAVSPAGQIVVARTTPTATTTAGSTTQGTTTGTFGY